MTESALQSKKVKRDGERGREGERDRERQRQRQTDRDRGDQDRHRDQDRHIETGQRQTKTAKGVLSLVSRYGKLKARQRQKQRDKDRGRETETAAERQRQSHRLLILQHDQRDRCSPHAKSQPPEPLIASKTPRAAISVTKPTRWRERGLKVAFPGQTPGPGRTGPILAV